MSNELNTPVEIDTAIAAQLFIHAKVQALVERQERYLNSEDAYTRHHFDADKYGAALAQLDAETARLDELQALYTGWERYWHVTNTNGHIHTSQSCTSCFQDTEYAWRTDLSGLTPEEVVEREAYNACSVCMPIAPAEQRAAREYYNRQQREQRAAEKAAAKREKELAKIPRAHSLAIKVNELFDTFGDEKHGEDGAYRATYMEDTPHGKRFVKGYDNAYYVYSDIIERRNRRAR